MTAYAPEEIEEAKCLDYDTHERPLEEHEQDATNETHGAAELLFPREEVECLLWPDDECHAGQEEQLQARCQLCLRLCTAQLVKHERYRVPATLRRRRA